MLYTLYVDLTTAYGIINMDFRFSFMTDPFSSSHSMSSHERTVTIHNRMCLLKTQTSNLFKEGENDRINLFNLFLDYALRLYKHRWEKICLGHWDIRYHFLNESANRRAVATFTPDASLSMMRETIAVMHLIVVGIRIILKKNSMLFIKCS